MTSGPIYVGVDVGASRTKVAILDTHQKMIGHAVAKSGTDFSAIAQDCLTKALETANSSQDDMIYAVATGYGRRNVSYAGEYRTEIACHARGCYHVLPQALTIIDIGGQDNKIIKIDDRGKRQSFKMNRKCAAGTGAFLEEMAARLDIPLEAMNDLASQSDNMVKLGSYCTVFSATEILEHIRKGKKITDIVKGVFFSVIKRVLEMDHLTDSVAMTGGVVAHNAFLVTMAEEIIERKILVPPFPQLTGAVGAALYAMEIKPT